MLSVPKTIEERRVHIMAQLNEKACHDVFNESERELPEDFNLAGWREDRFLQSHPEAVLKLAYDRGLLHVATDVIETHYA